MNRLTLTLEPISDLYHFEGRKFPRSQGPRFEKGCHLGFHMGVSKNRGTPKWMVKIMENPIKMDDLGIPPFLDTPICL